MKLTVKFNELSFEHDWDTDDLSHNTDTVFYAFVKFLGDEFLQWDVQTAFDWDTFKIDFEKEKVSIKFAIFPEPKKHIKTWPAPPNRGEYMPA